MGGLSCSESTNPVTVFRYTAMMQQVLSTPYFYFSYSYDISHSRQRLDSLGSRDFYQVGVILTIGFIQLKCVEHPFVLCSSSPVHCTVYSYVLDFIPVHQYTARVHLCFVMCSSAPVHCTVYSYVL